MRRTGSRNHFLQWWQYKVSLGPNAASKVSMERIWRIAERGFAPLARIRSEEFSLLGATVLGLLFGLCVFWLLIGPGPATVLILCAFALLCLTPRYRRLVREVIQRKNRQRRAPFYDN